MKKNDLKEIQKKKEEWNIPTLQIIPFRNTMGGGPESGAEDATYNPSAS